MNPSGSTFALTLRSDLIAAGFLFSAILLTIFVYWSGLSGPWLLDDIWNLQKFYEKSQIGTMDVFWDRVFSVDSGPSSRPISMASFLLNDYAMPRNPLDFKQTNLSLHILNGLFAFLLFQRLTYILTGSRRDSVRIGVAVSVLWLIHPLNVTTTLYVIQRMTQLMSLFALISILSYVYGRELLLKNRRYGLIFILVGLGPVAMLSVLSKENGALIPIYILAIECTIFSRLPRYPYFRTVKIIGMYFPLVLLLGYLLLNINHYVDAYGIRNYSAQERVMTQPRVIADYVARIFAPRTIGAGLIHDDYIISKSLLNPFTTILSIVGLACSLIIGYFGLRRIPILSFSIFFFLAGHLLESTVLPLEIYFEHRNYLPMLSIIFGASWAIYSVLLRFHWQASFLPVIGCLALAFSITSYTLSETWSDYWRILSTDYAEHPGSYRAKTNLADALYKAGDLNRSKKLFEESLQLFPEDIPSKLRLFLIQCELGEADADQLNALLEFIETGKLSFSIVPAVDQYLADSVANHCVFMGSQDIDRVYAALSVAAVSFPHMAVQYNLAWSWARNYADRGDLDAFMKQANRAYSIHPNFHVLHQQALALYSAGLFVDSMQFIEKAEAHLKKSRFPSRVSQSKLDALRERVKAHI